MLQNIIAAVLRHVLGALGGGIVASGLVTDGHITMAAGALATLTSIGLSIVEKKKRINKL